jgi:gentisate 1,2-dioxygenase
MVGQTNESAAAPPDAFHAAMMRANMIALWEWNDARSNEPTQSEPAFHWRWKDVEPVLDRAVAATDMNAAERRVCQLKNPAFPRDYVAVTSNINCGFQILMPGEKARPHRHNINALRFVVEGEGATTVVDGKECPMQVGDLIITPGMTWHEHVHRGAKRVVWMDSLDSPLVRHLRCVHFEPGPARNHPTLPTDSAFSKAGFAPARLEPTPYSPIFRYPGAEAVVALGALPAQDDGARILRYINPTTGGSVMSLMDCYLVGLRAGAETRPYRTTSNAACLVVEGAGVSTIGGNRISWEKYDVFTLPAWQWITHRAETSNARLFQVTDREILRRLELLRDEAES